MKLSVAILFFQLFLFSGITGIAQKSDTATVRLLHNKAYAFRSTYPDSLLRYRDSSYRLAVRLKDNVGVGESFTDLGVYYWVKGNYGEAIHAYDTSNQIFESIQRPEKRLTNLSNLGMVYSRLGDFPKAINTLLESLRLAEEFGDKGLQATIYNSLGVAYKNQGNIEEAFDAYAKALVIFKEIKNHESTAGCYTNIGNIYMLKKDFNQALDFQMKGLKIFDSLKNFRGLVTCYNNISDIHLALKNFKDALAYRNLALAQSKDHGFFSNEVVALSGIGSILSQMKDYKGAEQAFLEGIALAKSKNYRTEIVNLYKGISNCYHGLGNEKDALLYFEKYASLKDSLFSQQTLLTVSNLRTSYDLEKKEAAIKLLKKDNEITRLSRNRTVLGGTALFLITGLIVILQRQQIRKEKMLQAEREKLHTTQQALSQAELKTAKIKALRSQMNPHFIFNCLNTIQEQILQGNVVKATQYMGDFGLLLRKTLNNSDHSFIKLKEEIATIKLYLNMESIRFRDQFTWEVRVAQDLDVDLIQIPPMLIQPVLENAIHHGLLKIKGERQLTVDFFRQNRRVYCRVVDNGIGISSSQKNKSQSETRKSKGTILISDRISLLNEAYMLAGQIEVTDLANEEKASSGTRVELSFDANKLETI